MTIKIKKYLKKILFHSILFQKEYYKYCYKKYCKNKQVEIKNEKIEKKSEHGIIYVLAPEYSNIGDVAIFIKSIDFLNEHVKLPIKAILYSSQCINLKNIYSLPLYSDDVFVIQGGGNMGSVYSIEEILRQNIVKSFPNNRIISFPQSVWYGKAKNDYILVEAKKIYSNHKNLTLFTRDLPSFDFCKKNFSCNVKLCPDMVLSSSPKRISIYEKNKKVLLCFRKDIESTFDYDKLKKIEKTLLERGYNFEYWDTDDLSGKNIRNKESKIQNVLSYFNRFQFVITDRYHGTILSYISKTPCISFDNSYGKIKNGFYWFNGINYIFFAENENQMIESIKKIENLSNFVVKNDLEKHFSEMKTILLQGSL